MSTTVKANGVKNVSNNSRTVPSRCFTPPFWTFYLLSLNKSNLCPIGVDLPNIQVFILPKTGIKLIWRKALCQTSLLYVWKSKMKKRDLSCKKNYHVTRRHYFHQFTPHINPRLPSIFVKTFMTPAHFKICKCFNKNLFDQLWNSNLVLITLFK